MKYVIYLFLLIAIWGCRKPGYHYKIYIKNNSNDEIAVNSNCDFPDTIKKQQGAYLFIKPNTTGIYTNKVAFEDNIIKNQYKKMTIVIAKPNLPITVIKRYNLTVDTLQQLNWIITYP